MIICIAGLSGSGKNTVGEIVARRLGLRLIDPTFKTLADERRMELMDFHRKAEKEHGIDRDFDAKLMRAAEGGNCVATTWLAPWMIINADLRVWLYASQHARAARVAGRDGMGMEQAVAHVAERDGSNRTRYLDIYRIDIYDHSEFDLQINSEKFAPEKSAEIILAALSQKVGRARVLSRLQGFAPGAKKKPERNAKGAGKVRSRAAKGAGKKRAQAGRKTKKARKK